MINEDLQKFLTDNFAALVEQMEQDKKSWEDIIGHIIVSQDKYITTLNGRIYEMEQILNAQGEDRKPMEDGSDSTFMDDGLDDGTDCDAVLEEENAHKS